MKLNSKPLFRSGAVIVLSLLITAVFNSCSSPQTKQKQTQTKVAPKAVLNRLIQDQTDSFTFSKIRGAGEGDYKVEDISGQRVITAGRWGLVITGRKPYADNFIAEAIVKFAGPIGRRGTGYVTLVAGKTPDDKKNLKTYGLMLRAINEDSLLWVLPQIKTRKGRSGRYYLRMSGLSTLTWPDWIRKRVEHDIASQLKASEKWCSMKIKVVNGHAEVYLDDRFLHQAEIAKFAGTVSLQLPAGAQLKSFNITPLTDNEKKFLPVSISGYLNAAKINGKKLATESLFNDRGRVTVKGVPFQYSAPDQRGNDHIDLEPSWLRCGSMSGNFGPRGNNGRWRGVWVRNPARIQLRLPNARYNNIWLLAAADGSPDSIPALTVQFYRPNAGFVENVRADVPVIGSVKPEVFPVPAKFVNGDKTNLFLVKIPINPGMLAGFSDLEYLELELTKAVNLYRCYPDPTYYSQHQGGLPSGVHIYAMTMEKPEVTMSYAPGKLAHIWTAPDKPEYTVLLSNHSKRKHKVKLTLNAISYHGDKKLSVVRKVTLQPGVQEQKIKFSLQPKCFGHHRLELVMEVDGKRKWSEKFALAYLHKDTRERGNWQEGRGPIFGYWDWGGGHYTLKGLDVLKVMADAGAGSINRSLAGRRFSDEERKYAEKRGMKTFYLTEPIGGMLLNYWDRRTKVKFDPKQPKKMAEVFLKVIKDNACKKTAVTDPQVEIFFAEPGIDNYSFASLPRYCGEPEYKMDENSQKRYQAYLDKFLICARAMKKEYPQIKRIFPWGSPLFPVPFLRNSKEARELIDGLAYDTGFFERLPEQQIHQCSIHLLWEFQQEWQRFKKEKPYLFSQEGPCLASTRPGALTLKQSADRSVRSALIQLAYGITRQFGWPTPFAPGDYWGTQHYGGGMIERIPLTYPKPSYSAYATMTRQLNGMNLVKWLPTGSMSTYCLMFKHYKSGEIMYVIWCVKGKRQVNLYAAGKTPVVYDLMDNIITSPLKKNTVKITVSREPIFVRGLNGRETVRVSGSPDNSDSLPGKYTVKLAELGDGSWKISSERDKDYEDSHIPFIVRFPGKMTARPVSVGKDKLLAVHLEKQPKERKIMPFYTSLVPAEPITIPGNASYLGLWVTAASDWGRVVYCLRDANGERWLSVGKKDSWNCDDSQGKSKFCFDGKRYLKFDLPGNLPYDLYRENGSTWWGNYGKGDGIVDLPLKLEKIIVERRTHIMYVNGPEPVENKDVLLGELIAEYASKNDLSDEAVRLSKVRMPQSDIVAPNLHNPIAEMAASGSGAPTVIQKVSQPSHHYDGTRFLIFFDEVKDAISYDVWVSAYPDGRGAVRLGRNIKKSGSLIRGIKPDTDFYAFIVYLDKNKKLSKPSKSVKIHLKDLFSNK